MKVTVKKCKDEGRKCPWLVTYYVKRKPVRKYFKKESDAKKYAAEAREVLRSGADPATYHLALRAAAGTGYSLLELVESGLAYKQTTRSTKASLTATFGDGAGIYMKNQVDKEAADCTKYNTKRAFESTLAVFKSRIATSITDEEVKVFLENLAGRSGEPKTAAADTRKTMLGFIKGALRCVGIGNPLPEVPEPVIKFKPVKFFTVAESWKMLTGVPEELRGTVALALFASLRPHLLSRLGTVNINYRRREIDITPDIAKDRKPHQLRGERRLPDGTVITGTPNILWEWLEIYPYKQCAWPPLQRRLKKLIGHWIPDGTRHTAATYYYNIYGKAATAELLTHEGEDLVLKHYVGMTTPEDADAFYALKPINIPIYPPADKKTICWPSDTELERMLQETSATKIAAQLGCSDAAIAKRCRKRGIKKPNRSERMKAKMLKLVASEAA